MIFAIRVPDGFPESQLLMHSEDFFFLVNSTLLSWRIL
ncbi:hypothetical protein CUJ84_pRLN2000499 (plasmid) [Rhizobium leguminosarum]|uniref:Uncharacterized protein n=1 Tax=Rhizobium leguminosarum TaxID=384 RepID=A0A2K9ZFK8_RHILE|nr:hypothetical protein CUJ84_pRLN2000499 [Rhizobium leguminosarum]